MEAYARRSPVTFKIAPAQTAIKNGWEVVLEYENEKHGNCLIDLSHSEKWDIQGENLSSMKPCGMPIPETPGQCSLRDDLMINLLKWNWATMWQLSGDSAGFLQEQSYTNVTEAYCLLALIGKDIFSIMEKVTSLNLLATDRKPPFLLLGPVLHIRCQVVVLKRRALRSIVLVACPRGYGQSMADALLDAGSQWMLKPAGENVFNGSITE